MDESVQKHFARTAPEGFAKVLFDAANLIEKEGWIQGSWRSKHGRCMRGAVYGVFQNNGQPTGDAIPFLRALDERMEDGGSMRFNDAPGRTKEEVVAKMRAVALGG